MAFISECPPPAALQEYVLGRTPVPDAEDIGEHLRSCAPCLSLLPALDEADDLVLALRGQKDRPRPRSAVVEALRLRMQQLRQTWIHDGASTDDFRPGATPVPDGAVDDADELCSCLAPAQGLGELGRLGAYRVLKVLGAGGMGVVFQAEDVQLKRLVAVKVMRPALAASPNARKRFLREAQAAAAIEHDHVVAIHQVSEERGVPFLAMPLLKGESLEDRLRRDGTLPVAEVLRIGRETALGLAAAHAQGLIHRDVKPANLWLEAPAGRVKVLDFGLARSGDGDSNLSGSGSIVGTPGYMAPEQVGGTPDQRADLFSLGCVLYRAATGQLAFPGANALDVLRRVAVNTPAPARQINPQVPADLSALIERLLAKEPADRPVSAAAVIAAIDKIAVAKPARRRPRPPLLLATVLAVVAAVVVAGVIVIIRDRHGREIARIEIADKAAKGGAIEVIDRKAHKTTTVPLGPQKREPKKPPTEPATPKEIEIGATVVVTAGQTQGFADNSGSAGHLIVPFLDQGTRGEVKEIDTENNRCRILLADPAGEEVWVSLEFVERR